MAWIYTHIALIVGFLLAVILISHLLRQNRSPSSMAAWLLIILIFPYVGVPLYLMIGGRKMRRLAADKNKLVLSKNTFSSSFRLPPVSRFLQTYNLPGATDANTLSLCTIGEQVYQNLIALIEEATQSIHITTFIFAKDPVGRDILQRLVRKASEGIRVRLLLDGVGCLHTTRRFLRPLTRVGGEIAYFMPILHRPFRGRTNLRNHRKIVIVDGRYVMAGGTNIAEEYLGSTPQPTRWRDLSFVLEGPAVRNYYDIFRYDWEFAMGQTLPPLEDSVTEEQTDSGAVIQVVPSGPDVAHDVLHHAILTLIFSAQQRFWVATPYFIPDDSLQQALVLACHRGVDVRIIMPHRSNHRLADMARNSYLRELQESTARIFLYTHGMMHAKVVQADDEVAILGSANMDMRSLFLNYESAIFVYSHREILAVESYLNALMNDCPCQTVPAAGALHDMVEGMARIIAPLL